MAKTKQQKQEMLRQLHEMLNETKSLVFSTFSSLSIKDQENLRKKLREAGVLYKVFKKTLIKKALLEKGVTVVDIDSWFGNIAVAASKTDDIASAKTVVTASKGMEGFTVRSGFLEGSYVSVDEVKALASIPSWNELIAKAVGSIAAPISGLINVLQGNHRNLLNVLNQIKNSK